MISRRPIKYKAFQWIFINDAQQTTVLRTATDSAWTECRRGDTCEMRTESVVSTQQGTYQCVAINEYGRAMTQCYLLVGGTTLFVILDCLDDALRRFTEVVSGCGAACCFP